MQPLGLNCYEFTAMTGINGRDIVLKNRYSAAWLQFSHPFYTMIDQPMQTGNIE
jgi:hypothetical protein